jgi:hypothetical protein
VSMTPHAKYDTACTIDEWFERPWQPLKGISIKNIYVPELSYPNRKSRDTVPLTVLYYLVLTVCFPLFFSLAWCKYILDVHRSKKISTTIIIHKLRIYGHWPIIASISWNTELLDCGLMKIFLNFLDKFLSVYEYAALTDCCAYSEPSHKGALFTIQNSQAKVPCCSFITVPTRSLFDLVSC